MADQDRFARALLAIIRGYGRTARERARSGAVTPQQAETLQVIAERGTVSTSSLARLLGIDASTASRNLSGLQRLGLLARQKGSEDGRQTNVRLTPKGRRVAQMMASGAAQAISVVLDQVPRAERARVLEALELLARLMGERNE